MFCLRISGVMDLVQINFSDIRIVEMAALALSFQKDAVESKTSPTALVSKDCKYFLFVKYHLKFYC